MSKIIHEFSKEFITITQCQKRIQKNIKLLCEGDPDFTGYAPLGYSLEELGRLCFDLEKKLPYREPVYNEEFESSQPVKEVKRSILYLSRLICNFAYNYEFDLPCLKSFFDIDKPF